MAPCPRNRSSPVGLSQPTGGEVLILVAASYSFTVTLVSSVRDQGDAFPSAVAGSEKWWLCGGLLFYWRA